MSLAIPFQSFSQTPTADKSIVRKFDSVMSRLSGIKLHDVAAVRRVASQPEYGPNIFFGLSALKARQQQLIADIDSRKKSYLSGHSGGAGQQVDKDLLPLLNALPEPVKDLPAAKQTVKRSTDDNIYTRYIEKIENYQNGLQERLQARMPSGQQIVDKAKKDANASADRTKEMLANNPVIQQMGGMDKLMSMTPEQREALAKEMTAKVKANPQAYMQPVAQRMSHEESESSRQKGMLTVEIDQRHGDILQHAKEMADIQGALIKETNAYFTALRKQLADEYGRRIEALPTIEMGEAGHGKDTYQTDIAYAMIVYLIDRQQAIAEKEVWQGSLSVAKVTLAEYNDMLSKYYVDGVSRQLMEEKGFTPLGLSASYCEGLIQLAKDAKIITSQNSSWQRGYDEKVMRDYNE